MLIDDKGSPIGESIGYIVHILLVDKSPAALRGEASLVAVRLVDVVGTRSIQFMPLLKHADAYVMVPLEVSLTLLNAINLNLLLTLCDSLLLVLSMSSTTVLSAGATPLELWPFGRSAR